jgi:hypothetical protein
MAYAISAERTVLWDQIQYQGAPEDFAWVLPVKPGATLELSHDAWFEALDAVTNTRVQEPQLQCANSNTQSGCDCIAGGSSQDAKATSAAPGEANNSNNGVTVLHQATIGPYDTVTLQSTNGDALTVWLTDHGYLVPPDIAPTIASYVTEGFDFIALRLMPGQGVNQMKPVRVVTPGPEGPLPLRMVAAGVGAHVDIVLYTIGEARYSLPDLGEVFVDQSSLAWDFNTSASNYSTLRMQALALNFGASYLTAFSDRGAFNKTYSAPNAVPVYYSVNFATSTNLADLYFAQASADDSVGNNCASVTSALSGTSQVEAPASAFDCSSYDDIGAAMIGQHPANVWLSRLELDLPREALSVDCVVKPGPSQAPVSNQLLALKIVNRPASCPQVVFESGALGRSMPTRGAWFTALLAIALGRLRRWSKRE